MNIDIETLIAQIGSDNIQLQPLDKCMTNMQKAKGHILYTFGSEMPFDLNGTERLGLVIWLDRKTVGKILAGEKG